MLPTNNRLGFHYFPDTQHYREPDLQKWLPEVRALGASWMTLVAPPERAIPEFFLDGLLRAGVAPILHFQLPVYGSIDADELRLLFGVYARWGVRYVALFDRPNNRSAWQPSLWAQDNLVERFLDIFLPLAEIAVQEGLSPVFPPLEPGGDYWDIAFLKTALRGIKRRGCERVLDGLVIGAYGWAGSNSLEWGAGGAKRWTDARPYQTPTDGQDQLGFRIFDWYIEAAQAELGRTLPVILLRAGSLPDSFHGKFDPIDHAHKNMALARYMVGEYNQEKELPPELVACNFWLLTALESSQHASQAWFHPNGRRLPIVAEMRKWAAKRLELQKTGQGQPGNGKAAIETKDQPDSQGVIDLDKHPIDHYVLLPRYAWGMADWDLELVRPLLNELHPTVGFSLVDACLASRVTVVGDGQAFSDESLDMLRSCGCQVERLSKDGTIIAP